MDEPAKIPQWRRAMRLSLFMGLYWFVLSSGLHLFDLYVDGDGVSRVLSFRWLLDGATSSMLGMVVSPMMWLLLHPRHRFALVMTMVFITAIVVSQMRTESASSAVAAGGAAQLLLPLFMRLLSDWWSYFRVDMKLRWRRRVYVTIFAGLFWFVLGNLLFVIHALRGTTAAVEVDHAFSEVVSSTIVGMVCSPVLWPLLSRHHRMMAFILTGCITLVVSLWVVIPLNLPTDMSAGLLVHIPLALMLRFILPARRSRFHSGHCPECDYELHGAYGRTCPECGWKGAGEADAKGGNGSASS